MTSDTPIPLPEFTDAPSIAQALNIDRRTFRRLVLRGAFPKADLVLGKTINRWSRATVAAWLASNIGR